MWVFLEEAFGKFSGQGFGIEFAGPCRIWEKSGKLPVKIHGIRDYRAATV